jgi:HD-like signal output (HDOD) protein
VFPLVALRVREVVADDRSSLAQLERVVSLDPALSAQVLRVANSSFYGLSRDVSTVRQAILVLGFRATRDLSLALALASSGRASGDLGRALWWHALRTGVAARELSMVLPEVDPGEALVVGLLHDLGQFILLATEPRAYRSLWSPDSEDHGRLLAAERQVFGAHHAEVGAAALRMWLLPEVIARAVEAHGEVEGTPLSARVSIAERFERALDDGDREEALRVAVDGGVARERANAVIDRFDEEMSQWAQGAADMVTL